MRGRWKIGLKVDSLCTSQRLTQYLLTGVSTVCIRLRRSFPLLAWWCAILLLGHSGVTAWSSESGASYHYRDLPGTKKKKKNESRSRLQDFIFRKLKIEQVLNTHKKKEKTTCRLATNMFSPIIIAANLISSLSSDVDF